MKKVAILGSGVLGSAMAIIASANGCEVVMYSNDIDSIEEINKKHTNSRYVNCLLNENITASSDLAGSVDGAEYIFVILPSKVVSSVLAELKGVNAEFAKKFVIFSKGIDETSGKFFSDVVYDFFPKSNVAVLSGPNFAEEIVEKRMTITTVATRNIMFFDELERILNCDYFEIEYFDDLKAVQLSGLVKNVLAILCGVAEGLNLGKNTFAAIMLRGIKEINSLCLRFNYNERVISAPAGIGDVVLTCSSRKSRNMSLGFRIGSGEKISDILSSSSTVVEGLNNAKKLSDISREVGVSSIADIVLDITQNNYSKRELTSVVMNKIFRQNERER
jgi:glycerol-3-phosphate dehydrogenase (NAD(P)+)